MDDHNKDNLDASDQDVDTSVDNDTNDTSDDSGDDKYENQKKRAEKAEAEAKAEKAKREELEQKVQALTQKDEPKSDVKSDEPLSREETILIAKGFGEDALQEAKDIAAGKGISLTEAIETSMFQAWQEKMTADKADQDAQLGASTGSAPHSEKKFERGMSEAEHKALWEKKNPLLS